MKKFTFHSQTKVLLTYEEIFELALKEFEKIKACDYKDHRAILGLIRDVVDSIQRVDDEIAELSGHQKKDLAIDMITWLVYDKYKLGSRFVPNFIEKKIFKFFIGKWIIDGVVEWFKNRLK